VAAWSSCQVMRGPRARHRAGGRAARGWPGFGVRGGSVEAHALRPPRRPPGRTDV